MNFYDVIKQRRSIRDYLPDKKIPDEVLIRILEADRIAPSAANRQPWKIMAIKDKNLRQRVCESYKGKWLRNAPVILVVVGYREQAWVRPKDRHSSMEVDLTIAMDHMILAAAAEGIGTCWIMAFDYDILKQVLNLKDNQSVSCITPLGYPSERSLKEEDSFRKEFDEVVEIV